MQKVQAHDDESGSGSGSGASDLSNLENNTDTLGRAILRHERDARRLQSVLSGARQALGMPHSYASKRLQRLGNEHDTRVDPPQPRARDVEPDLNVPRAWNTRRKVEEQWTRQPHIPAKANTREQQPAVEVDRDTIVPHVTVYTGDEWDENEALGNDDTPPSMKRRRPLAQPTSLRHMNSRMRHIVQAGTVTAAVSSESSQPTKRPPLMEADQAMLLKDRVEAFRQRRYPRVDEIQAAKPPSPTFSDKENVPEQIPAHNVLSVTSRTASRQAISGRAAIRNNHNRSDSMQMLERLAKVTQSPPRNNGPKDIEPMQIEPPTPLVVGGWLDTPKPEQKAYDSTADVVDSGQGPSSVAEPPSLAISAEISQRKALADITPAADAELPKAQSGAIDSLASVNVKKATEGMKPEAIDPTTATQTRPVADAAPNPMSAPTQKVQPELQTQATSSDASNSASKISMLNKHIADVLVAHQDSTKATRRSSTAISTRGSTRNKQSTHLLENGRTICEHCGGAYTSVWRGLWVEFRINFYVKDKSAPLGIRATPLGWAVLTWLCWLLLETVLCARYCQPRYATWMVGTGVLPNAPIFPFVIPTLMLKPFEPLWRPLKRYADWLIALLLNSIFGEDVILSSKGQPVLMRQTADSVRYATKTTRQPAEWVAAASTIVASHSRRALASAVEAIDDVGQMW